MERISRPSGLTFAAQSGPLHSRLGPRFVGIQYDNPPPDGRRLFRVVAVELVGCIQPLLNHLEICGGNDLRAGLQLDQLLAHNFRQR